MRCGYLKSFFIPFFWKTHNCIEYGKNGLQYFKKMTLIMT